MSECHPFEKRCVHFEDDRRNISLKDDNSKGGCKFVAENPSRKRIACLCVDGCLIPDLSTKKCDYLLLNCLERKAVFIELKGQNISKAIDQLNLSIESLYPQLRSHGYVALSAIVVVTSGNRTEFKNLNSYVRLRKTLRKHNGEFQRFTSDKIQNI